MSYPYYNQNQGHTVSNDTLNSRNYQRVPYPVDEISGANNSPFRQHPVQPQHDQYNAPFRTMDPGQHSQHPQHSQQSYQQQSYPQQQQQQQLYSGFLNSSRETFQTASTDTRPFQESLSGADTTNMVSQKRAKPVRDTSDFSPLALEFYDAYCNTIQDVDFTPEVQLKWVETLLLFAFKPDFVCEYNINAEKLKRRLTNEESHKNQKILVEHALKVLNKLNAEHQYPDSLYLLGTLYSNTPFLRVPRGILKKNEPRALELYVQAAESGHAKSAYRAAVCYEFGKGVAQDMATSLRYYQKASELGDVSSMYKLGQIYLRGSHGQRCNASFAFQWFTRAAELATKETPHALYEVGKFYERDFPQPVDPSFLQQVDQMRIGYDAPKALGFYLKAAKLGYPLAQLKLGSAYEFGRLDLEISPSKSIAWYAKAAKSGNPIAEMALSGWYLTGAQGVLEPSDKDAFEWAKRSAEKGFVKAEYAVGYFYETGLGCQPDSEQSLFYYRKAAHQGHKKAIEKLKAFGI